VNISSNLPIGLKVETEKVCPLEAFFKKAESLINNETEKMRFTFRSCENVRLSYLPFEVQKIAVTLKIDESAISGLTGVKKKTMIIKRTK